MLISQEELLARVDVLEQENKTMRGVLEALDIPKREALVEQIENLQEAAWLVCNLPIQVGFAVLRGAVENLQAVLESE